MDKLEKTRKPRRWASPFWWMIAALCVLLALGLGLLIYGLSLPRSGCFYVL